MKKGTRNARRIAGVLNEQNKKRRRNEETTKCKEKGGIWKEKTRSVTNKQCRKNINRQEVQSRTL
jgi:hypothetical protein